MDINNRFNVVMLLNNRLIHVLLMDRLVLVLRRIKFRNPGQNCAVNMQVYSFLHDCIFADCVPDNG